MINLAMLGLHFVVQNVVSVEQDLLTHELDALECFHYDDCFKPHIASLVRCEKTQRYIFTSLNYIYFFYNKLMSVKH